MTTAERIAAIHASLDELERAIAASGHDAELQALDERVKKITAGIVTGVGDGAIVMAQGSLGVAT